MAMDSVVQLALILKAKKVFEAENTFLSFPVTPLAYEKEDLEFFSQDTVDALRKSKENLQAFSTLVNLIPRDEAWLPTETRFLWDEYEKVLDGANFPSSIRTPEEEVKYQEAYRYLNVTGEGGIMQESLQVMVYKQHRDAHFMVLQEYAAAKSTGETAEDEAEKKQWKEVDEPAFRLKIIEAENKWIHEGNKTEVEIARSTYARLGAKSPELTWDDWRGKFIKEIDQETDAGSNFSVWPSGFAPPNALEEGSWKTFSLNEAEVNALVNEAPAELRTRFSADGRVSSIKSMTLEFSSALIFRPWFESEVFRARFWRFSDATKLISNGSTPPSGDCPAYVVAIVFARKVVVEQNQVQNTPPNQNVFGGLHFNYVVKDQNMITRVNPEILRAVQPQRMNPQPMQPQVMRMQPLRPQITKMAPRTVAPVRPAGIRAPTQPTGGGGALLRPGVAATVGAQQNYFRAMQNLNASMYTRLPQTPVMKPMPPPARPPSAPPTSPDENVYILAFICRPLAKCPDPDPTLQW